MTFGRDVCGLREVTEADSVLDEIDLRDARRVALDAIPLMNFRRVNFMSEYYNVRGLASLD